MSERRPLGQILLKLGHLTREQLVRALEYQLSLSAQLHLPLGQILCNKELITESQLNQALGLQPPFKTKPVGEILVDMGVINAWQMSRALCYQYKMIEGKQDVSKIGDILVKMGFTTHDKIELALGQFFGAF